MAIKEILTFDRMIAPKLIKVLFWLGLFGILVSGIGLMSNLSTSAAYAGRGGSGISGFGSFLVGLFYIGSFGVFWRVFCEFMIVLFTMNSRLGSIEKSLET